MVACPVDPDITRSSLTGLHPAAVHYGVAPSASCPLCRRTLIARADTLTFLLHSTHSLPCTRRPCATLPYPVFPQGFRLQSLRVNTTGIDAPTGDDIVKVLIAADTSEMLRIPTTQVRRAPINVPYP